MFLEFKKEKRHFLLANFFLILFILNTPVKGFPLGSFPEENRFNKNFLENLGDDILDTYKSPGNWGKKDFLRFSALTGGSIFLFVLDREIQDWFQENDSSASREASHFFSNWGDGLTLGALIGALYASGEFFERDGLRKTALMSLESWAATGALVMGLKLIIGRARPYASESESSFHPFSFSSRYYSFPSGHASSAFAVATVIADQTDELAVDLLAYSVAALAAVSRVHDNKHWVSDVFAGSALGYFIGKKICGLNKKREGEKVRVFFQVMPKKQALSLCLQF